MIYNTQSPDKPAKRKSKIGTAIALATLTLGSFALGGLLLAPTIRAGSRSQGRGDDLRPAPSRSAPAPAPAGDSGSAVRHSRESAKAQEPAVQITVVGPSRTRQKADATRSARADESGRATKADAVRPKVAPPRERLLETPRPARTAEARPMKNRTARRSSSRVDAPDEIYYAGASSRDAATHEEATSRHRRRDDDRDGPEDRDLAPGKWTGYHTGNPATLRVTHVRGDRFRGALTVRIGGQTVQTGVSGGLSERGGISWDETEVVRGDPAAWDLGSNEGRLRGDRMQGRGRDSRGRSYRWSFSAER
jgi:hypothetical protein